MSALAAFVAGMLTGAGLLVLIRVAGRVRRHGAIRRRFAGAGNGDRRARR